MRYAAGLCLVLLLSALPGEGEPVTIEGVAAYVNDSLITVGEIKEMMAPALAEMEPARKDSEWQSRYRELYKEALEDLIATRLILGAYEADTKINKAAVEKHVEARVSEFIQERFDGDRQEFLKALQAERLTLEEWRLRLRDRIIVGLMRSREVDSRIVVSPREVRAAYEAGRDRYQRPERVKLRAILVRGGTNGTDRAARETLAKSVAGKLQAGEDFGDCARRFSEDPSAAKGGDWGWVAVPDLRPELARAIAALGPGQSGGVVEMDGDFYLLRIEEREKAGVVPFEDVRSNIEKDLRRKESRRLFQSWLQVLRKDAHIERVEVSMP